MVIWISNFDNFDIYQMPSKFAQRQYYICNFCCKKIYNGGSLDNAENAKRNFFFNHPISNIRFEKKEKSSVATRRVRSRPPHNGWPRKNLKDIFKSVQLFHPIRSPYEPGLSESESRAKVARLRRRMKSISHKCDVRKKKEM